MMAEAGTEKAVFPDPHALIKTTGNRGTGG